MKKYLLFLFALFFVSLLKLEAGNWEQYTVYDEFPNLNKILKPAYSDSYPEWAKMLYQYPINYNEIVKKYEKHIAQYPEKNNLTRYFKLWRQAVESYAAQDGKIIVPDLEKLNKQILETQLANSRNSENTSSENLNTKSNKSQANPPWTFVGPKDTWWLNEGNPSSLTRPYPWQVNIYSFDVSNSNPNILYCGTETGFVNKSTDKGENWEIVGKNYNFGSGITSVAIDPKNPNIVYVGAGNNVHKSTNAGNSWKASQGSINADRLIIDPSNNSRLLCVGGKGIFLSNDAGNTWTNKWNKITYDIKFNPANPNIVYALGIGVGNSYNFLLSTDAGANFSLVNNLPSTMPLNESGAMLAVTMAKPNNVYLLLLSADTVGTSKIPYLYKAEYNTNDKTFTWTFLNKGVSPNFPLNNGQGYYDLVFAVSPKNENVILAGTQSFYKSSDGGATFGIIGGYSGNFTIHPDVQDIKMLASGETWLATDGGLNYTSDDFTSTSNYNSKNKNVIGSDFWGFDQAWNEDLMVGGRYHNGNTAIASYYNDKALRMGGGESPTGWVLQGKERSVAFNDLGAGFVLPKKAEDKVESRFIFSKFPNMDEYGGRRSNLVHHPNYFGTLYLGSENSFWKSTDMGTSFSMIYTFPDRVRYLQISYSNPNVIYADIVGSGLYKSTDGGYNWISKPSLTDGNNGKASWNGKLFFSISPYNPNVIYACLQNGMWSNDLGQVFRSNDGGDSWENWSGSLNEYLKCVILQPTTNNKVSAYLFTQGRNSKSSKVYYRSEDMPDWVEYSDIYPAGYFTNLALPFYKDSKLRVAGSGGIWEVALKDEFTPIVNPWVENQTYACGLDTVYLEDHSILNHNGATWKWEISPSPIYSSNLNERNPKFVPGNKGEYSIKLTISQNGKDYTKSIDKMINVKSCPSISDCSNPDKLPISEWKLLSVDSEEKNGENGRAINIFDGDPATIWHTAWSSNPTPNYPHQFVIDLSKEYSITKFISLPRQNGSNGRIKKYEFYASMDTTNWGNAVVQDSFPDNAAPQTVSFAPKDARFIKFVALSERANNPWASMAELSIIGCISNSSSDVQSDDILQTPNVFPIPTSSQVQISLPFAKYGDKFTYTIFDQNAKIIESNQISFYNENVSLDFSKYPNAIYFVRFSDEQGRTFSSKIIKK